MSTPPTIIEIPGVDAVELVATEDRLTRAASLLRDAADRIARCGLHQGEYWPTTVGQPGYIEDDPCCALGALAVAADVNDPYRADGELNNRPELVIALDTLADQVDPDNTRFDVVPPWNDHPLRTAAEVTAAMRAAAAQLEPIPYRLAEPSTGPPPAPPGADPSARCTARPGGPSATSFHQAGTSSTRQHSTSEVIGNV
ncbi:MAG: DUF6197 family protein [Pseudonocardia sp.]